jgi:hypothetical protein
MPVVSMFFGIIVRMFHFDDIRHHIPHIHIEYQGDTAVVDIESGEMITGSFPFKKLRLVQAWIEIHKDELIADWKLAVEGREIFKINPLQ